MKAIVFNRKGSPTKNMVVDLEQPIPAKNELLIRVMAASVNAADYRVMKMGLTPKRKYFGADISGVVESLGAEITQFKIGDEIIGDLSDFGFGGFAEYAIAPPNALVKKPVNISFKTAAAIPLAALTAFCGLQKGHITANQDVLIVGSSGGVGTFAVQLAKFYKAKVTAVCSGRNAAQARELGADWVIDYTQTDFTQDRNTYDLILAINGNYPLAAYKRILKPSGFCVMIGGSFSQIFKFLIFGWIFSLGSKKLISLAAKSNQKDLQWLVQLVADGRIKPKIEKEVPVEAAPEALEEVMKGHAQGKYVILFGVLQENKS
jgi:NADPH:quinone reductase-like Zn-dependent oxidoreductase